ncbi:phosphatidylinositol-specific phospholipase C domain-containing protein [Streptomyces sp. NPDC058955]|uniref:phosphatidylinositol-specific phospholipase C domain-containing protein n=1 Tax=unclassified Streptomyces TaxID=2593676 RepID=UPI00365C5F02
MFKRDHRPGRLVRAAVGALTLALAALALPGATGSADAAEGPPNRLGPVAIQNVSSGFAVDVDGGDMAEDQKVLQRYYKAERRQQWWFEATGAPNQYYIKSNVNGAYCLSAAENAVVLKLCGQEKTAWIFDELATDTYRLKLAGTDRYLLAPFQVLKPGEEFDPEMLKRAPQGGEENSGLPLLMGDEALADIRGKWYLNELKLEPYEPPADPRLDQATFLTTHNAFNSSEYGYPGPNQSRTLRAQLNEGVRGLMLDVYNDNGQLRMCHSSCFWLGGITLERGLKEIREYMEANTDEIVTLFIESGLSGEEQILMEQTFEASGLGGLIFNPAKRDVKTQGWPRLSDMRRLNKRLLVFSDRSTNFTKGEKNGNGEPIYYYSEVGLAFARDWTVENYWSLGVDGNNFECYSRWSEIPLTQTHRAFTPLFVMNQFRDAPTTLTAPHDNGPALVDRALNYCGPAARKTPNYVAVDYFEYPSAEANRQAVAEISRHRYPEPPPSTPVPGLPASADITSGNRRAPLPGLPDWTAVGYRGTGTLPAARNFTTDAACVVSPRELTDTYGVRVDDALDDSAGLQSAIDHIRTVCSPTASFDKLSLIELPFGRIDITRQIAMDADYLVLRGQGRDAGGTNIVFTPDANTRYDTLTADGSRWDQDAMTYEAGADTAKGGWIWPGRGLFRVQTREVAPRYADEWAAAPANRKDLYEGSVNQHWASGVKLRGATGDSAYSAREGGTVVHLASNADMSRFAVGGHLWVGAANSRKFYEQQAVTDTGYYEDLHMRQQVFRISGVDAAGRTVTLDKPLEFDLPLDSTSDGSAPIGSTPYVSKVTPLKMVVGVGFENFAFTQQVDAANAEQPGKNDYGNRAPADALHGLVFKWAADSWVRNVGSRMTGSHPIVTEVAKNLQFEKNVLDGAWNKGKGGNGYFRGSRVWDSLYAFNTTRNLRHFTLQWSASGNVVYGNDFDSDLNLHGGWERRNLFEKNVVRVSAQHAPGNCSTNCGGEGGGTETGTWYPIWWAAGAKAAKWAGSSGPQNVFHDNVLTKQLTAGGPFTDYAPYTRVGTGPQPVFQFGSDPDLPSRFRHLALGGSPISDWNTRETADFTGAGGVNNTQTGPVTSVFLNSTG